jgi:TIR domain
MEPWMGVAVNEQANGKDDRVKVFISYSRRDLAFTERLVEALNARSLAAKIDTRDLPKLEDWRRELLGFIREADAVVFVVSSHSVTSHVCSWEIEQVAALGKRLAPIVLERVPDDHIPEAIAKINYIYFDEPEKFEAQADALAQALQTDLTWVKNHTRLGELAHRWSERGRGGALTLRGQELEEAERWIASHPRSAPEPTELHKSFLADSRRAATRRLRYGVAGALAIGALALGLAAYAFVQQRAAEASRANAVKALAASDLQRGTTALLSDETTAEGMAYLARAVRRGQDQRAITRLWTLLQQRSFWFPTAEPVRASPPVQAAQSGQLAQTSEVPQRIKDRFAKFKIQGEERETQFISMSADGKLVFTSIGRGTVDGEVLYRIWRADGTPVSNWLRPQYKGIQWVAEARGTFSPDGRFLALEVRPWREISLLQLFDVRSGKRVGDEDIVASGPQPQRQGVGFSRLEFVAETPASSDDLGFFLLAVSEKGDATVFRLQSSGPMQQVRNRHSEPIVFAGLDPASEWLMSASSDGMVRISAVKEGDAIGNVLQLGFAATSVQRLGASGLVIALANGEQHAFALHPAVRIVPPQQPEVTVEACKRWDQVVGLSELKPFSSARGELSRVGTRQLRIAGAGGQPVTSPTFAADIVLVCLNAAGDRLAVTTADFVTEVWAIDFSQRFGLPIVERRLFGSELRPETTQVTVPSPDGRGLAIESFFFDPPNVGYRWLSYWDLESALPLTDREPFGDDDLVGQLVRMDPSGHYLLIVGDSGDNKAENKDGMGRLPSLQVVPPPSVTAWIADLAEAIAGVTLDDQGMLVPVADRLAKLERGSRALAEVMQRP